MADTRETTATAGRTRGGRSGLVMAGDRTESRRGARRHSAIVRGMKIGLPLGALTLAGVFAASVMQTVGWGSKIADLALPQILPEHLKMENPHYEGFNGDGGRYWVRADTAQQDLKALNKVTLAGITGELVDGQDQTTRLKATRGTFDSKSNVLELFDSIDVDGDDGLKAKLTRATIATKEGLITSEQPVSVAMPTGTVTSRQMKIRQKAKEYTFVEDVRARVNPPEPQPGQGPAAPATPAGFGEPGKPIDVAASRLDVDDTKKTALFSGSVVATQGQSTLTTPELAVTYTGQAMGGGTNAGKRDSKKAPVKQADDKQADEGRVKSIVARDPVVMKQADGSTVTSRAATFDTAARTALLEGDIVMAQTSGGRAVGDRLDFDDTSGMLTLSGAVVVTQGTNELKGRKLVFNRGTGAMQLTGTNDGAGGGRIAARFEQQRGKARTPTKDRAADSGGVKFGATFKTDPDAPINVEANRLAVDDQRKQATFTGDVRAKQGEFFIRSEELVASYTGSASLGPGAQAGQQPAQQTAAQLKRISAKNKVQITSNDGQKATGDWAEFDTAQNLATLGGNVVLTQGKNVVRGTKLVIDMNTGETTIRNDTGPAAGAMISSSEGDGSGVAQESSRPSAVFYPNEFKEKARGAADGWQSRTAP